MINLDGFDAPEIVLGIPQRYGGSLPDEKPESSAEHMAFGITTSAHEAQKAQDFYEQTQAYSAPVIGMQAQGAYYPPMQSQNLGAFSMPQMQSQN